MGMADEVAAEIIGGLCHDVEEYVFPNASYHSTHSELLASLLYKGLVTSSFLGLSLIFSSHNHWYLINYPGFLFLLYS